MYFIFSYSHRLRPKRQRTNENVRKSKNKWKEKTAHTNNFAFTYNENLIAYSSIIIIINLADQKINSLTENYSVFFLFDYVLCVSLVLDMIRHFNWSLILDFYLSIFYCFSSSWFSALGKTKLMNRIDCSTGFFLFHFH